MLSLEGLRKHASALPQRKLEIQFDWRFNLSQCARMWNLMKPHAICGFAVSRTAAEALLAEQPLGSFLVRLCSEAGAFAISCCMGGPGGRPYVDHLLIDAVDLQGRSLEHWVLAHEFATQLLDPLSDKVYPKVRPRDLCHPQYACLLSDARTVALFSGGPLLLGACVDEKVVAKPGGSSAPSR
jgi:hypothetical protein